MRQAMTEKDAIQSMVVEPNPAWQMTTNYKHLKYKQNLYKKDV